MITIGPNQRDAKGIMLVCSMTHEELSEKVTELEEGALASLTELVKVLGSISSNIRGISESLDATIVPVKGLEDSTGDLILKVNALEDDAVGTIKILDTRIGLLEGRK